MQIKVDSSVAIQFLPLHRSGSGAVHGLGEAFGSTTEPRRSGVAELLFKSPMTGPGLYPEHDLFIQSMKLKNTLRHLMGEEMITHLGLDYYD